MTSFNDITGNSGQNKWAIGVGKFDHLKFSITPIFSTPIITAKMIGEHISFVADPFLIDTGNCFFVFTEVWNRTLNHGTIAVVELTKSFQYIRSREVLTEPFHLSYPYVFKYNNSYYMLPEAWESKQLRLYKSKCFPWSWELHSILINDIDYADPTLCIFNDMFYIILNSDPLENSQTELYFSKNITGKWRKHSSLIQIRNPSRSSRSAGKLLSLGNKTYRFTQDCHKKYGMGVNVTEILEISPKSYHQNELNIINLERPYWALSGFHHVDVFKNKNHYFALFDGYS